MSSNGTIAGMSREEWQERCRRYAERMASLTPEQKAHALCDHGNGYCQEGDRY